MTDGVDKVVRLVDRKSGFRVDDRKDLIDWLRAWADNLEKAGDVDTIIVVVEREDGLVYKVSQSIDEISRSKAIGLLTVAVHQTIEGTCGHPL